MLSQLSLNELKVPSSLSKELLVTACLLDIPILYHMDDVAASDRTQAMSNGDRRSEERLEIQPGTPSLEKLEELTVPCWHYRVPFVQTFRIAHREHSSPLQASYS